MFDTDSDPDPDPPRLGYYLAVAVFLATLALAVLGLVRVTSLTDHASPRPEGGSRPVPSRTAVAGAPVPTAQIPPPTPSAPTRPPSTTYLYPPPEESVTAGPAMEDQPRR